MITWKIYTALPQDVADGFTDALVQWESNFAKVTGGFTRYETYGSWYAGGFLYEEPGHVYEVLDFDHHLSVETMNFWRESLRQRLSQQVVLLTMTTTGQVVGA